MRKSREIRISAHRGASFPIWRHPAHAGEAQWFCLTRKQCLDIAGVHPEMAFFALLALPFLFEDGRERVRINLEEWKTPKQR